VKLGLLRDDDAVRRWPIYSRQCVDFLGHAASHQTKAKVMVVDIEYRVSSIGIEYLVSSIEYRVSSIEYRVSSIEYRVSSIEYRVSSIEYRVSSIEYRVSSIEYRVSSIEYRVQKTGPLLTITNMTIRLQTSNKYLTFCLPLKSVVAGVSGPTSLESERLTGQMISFRITSHVCTSTKHIPFDLAGRLGFRILFWREEAERRAGGVEGEIWYGRGEREEPREPF
jgi:hypothetical protein